MTVTTGPKGYFSEVWMDPLLKRVLPFAVFLHLPRRSGKLQPVMIELRRCSDGGWYPLDPVDNGAEEGEENQSFRGGSMVNTQKMFGRDVLR